MVPRPNPIGVKAAAGFPAENLLPSSAAGGTGSESVSGFLSLWTSIRGQAELGEDGASSDNGDNAGAAFGQAPGTVFLKPSVMRGEPAGAGEEPEGDLGLLPPFVVYAPACFSEPSRPLEWTLTGEFGSGGLPHETARELLPEAARENPEADEAALPAPPREPLLAATNAPFVALPQLSLPEQTGQDFSAAAAAAPATSRQQAAPESDILQADAGPSDKIRPSGPARSGYLVAEMLLHREPGQGAPPEPAHAQPGQSRASAVQFEEAEIATSEGSGRASALLPHGVGKEGASRPAAGQAALAAPNFLRQAVVRELGKQAGLSGQRGGPAPQTGSGPSAAATRSRGTEEIPADLVERFPAEADSAVLPEGQAANSESGARSAAETGIGSPGSFRTGAGNGRPQASFAAGREPEPAPGARLDARPEALQAEPLRRQLHVAVEGPEGVRVDVRLLHTPGALHLRLTSSEQAMAEALRGGQHQLEQALEGAGWSVSGERTHAAHNGASLVHPQDGLRLISGAGQDHPAAMAALETLAGSHDLMDGGAGSRGRRSAPELRQEWLDLSALRRFSRQGGQTSK